MTSRLWKSAEIDKEVTAEKLAGLKHLGERKWREGIMKVVLLTELQSVFMARLPASKDCLDFMPHSPDSSRGRKIHSKLPYHRLAAPSVLMVCEMLQSSIWQFFPSYLNLLCP